MQDILKAFETLNEAKIDIIKKQILGIKLSWIEFAIILVLLRENRELNRKEIAERLRLRSSNRNIDVHICRIREKFINLGFDKNNKFPIETSYGNGYRLAESFFEKISREEKAEG